jgi:hypothetical protein
MVLLKQRVENFRMKRLCIAVCFAGLAGPALAQTVTVTGVDCRKLARYTPPPGVEYQPGVDVRGRKVAPADVNAAPQIRAPETVTFDAAVDLRRFGIPASSPLFQPNVAVGTVQVEKDGRVLFNRQPLGDPEIAALEELCRERVRGR